ncbi:uncharacterized protein F5147DRAFT_588351, partial [Suillus discolor]
SCAGSYSSSVLSNFVAALKAWHLLHGREWRINPQELKSTLNGAAMCAPERRICLLILTPVCKILQQVSFANVYQVTPKSQFTYFIEVGGGGKY